MFAYIVIFNYRFSAFVKSGGEMFILGETSVNVSAEDYVEIIVSFSIFCYVV